MRRLALIATILIVGPAPAQDSRPGDLVPIEVGVSDMNTLGTSLKQMPVELNETTNFQRLFGVAGRPDLLVRSQGGMYGVFDQGQYVRWKSNVFAVWPAGTQYFIGRPDFSRMRAAPMRIAVDTAAQQAPGIRVAQRVREDDVQVPGPKLRVDRRPDALPDSRVPDARLPDARVGAAPLRPGQQTAPASAGREESHAVPDGSKRVDTPGERTAPPAQSGAGTP